MLNLQNSTFSASVINLERGTAVKSHHVQLVCPVENGGFHGAIVQQQSTSLIYRCHCALGFCTQEDWGLENEMDTKKAQLLIELLEVLGGLVPLLRRYMSRA